MQKQKSTFLFAAALGLCMLSAIIFTGCNDNKESSTETTTVKDSMQMPTVDSTNMMAPDTNHIDTASQRPIVPGN
ncbi:MAG: hypothetical protein ABIY51_14465 [Ferruginibacter sp.]